MSGDKYKTVWVDKANAVWDTAPTPRARDYGPFTEAKVVPADAIVIEAERVPERLADWERGLLFSSDPDPFAGLTAEEHWDRALSHIAEAQHLRANPPVDEAEVERIVAILRSGNNWSATTAEDAARRLYLAGVRAPEVTK